ncbi:MAG: cysteine desulfurase [Bacteroidales bacterium]|nr:cysteine desulfurase [Candidatus Colimorpha pelethequi]
MNLREQFPILDQEVYGHPLVYFDNAATTQKPRCVIDTLSNYYLTLNSNIHRGAHHLAAQATEAYEATRQHVQRFINARHNHEIVFTRGTTESINLVAASFGQAFLNAGDEVIVSGMEHHSDIVPWQLACERKGARLRVIPFSDEGILDLDAYRNLFTEKTRIVAVNHVSNTLGTINPIKEIIAIAHSHNVPVLIDGAQAISHIKVDVQELDCDFYCFSGHKMYAPMGVGVMYGKEEWLDKMPPYQGGGEMIKTVTFEKTTYNELPFKFEAGTPSVGDVLGLESAMNFMESIGIDAIFQHEHELTQYATEQLLQIPNMRIFGTAPNKTSVISFLIGNAHPYDVGTLLDKLGIAVRTGHHCTQPIMDRYGIPGTVRASFAIYNTREEIDLFIKALNRIAPMLE